MKFLKGFALFILGLLLFLSLSIFGPALMINQTVLNPDFAVSQVNKLDIATLTEDFLRDQITQTGAEEQLTATVINNTVADLEPWLKEQLNTGIYSFYDYLEGRSQSPSLVISTAPVKESLRDNLREAVLTSPPPELSGLPPEVVDQYIDQFYEQLSQAMPAQLDLNEYVFSPELLGQLEVVRQGISYFHLGFNLMIGFMLLLILLIILVHREVKGSTRSLGITFLTFGALNYIGILLSKHLAGTQLAMLDMPAYIKTLAPGLVKDILAPMEFYSLGLLIGGVILIIVSIAYRPRRTEF